MAVPGDDDEVVDDGSLVDVTLVDSFLSLTPEERLLQNDRMVNTIQELRDAFAARQSDDPPGVTRGRGR